MRAARPGPLARVHLALRGGVAPRLPVGEALHPVALAAAAALVVNDWVLKPSAAPGWLTGKLSDVAGLVFAPVALTAVVGLVRALARAPHPGLTPRRLAVAVAATGAVFTVIKLSPAAAAWFAATWSRLVPGGARVVADPTDLVALPALAVAWWIGTRELAWQRVAARDQAARDAAAAGA